MTADIPLLRTDDAETGEVIDNRRIEELPQYDRNVLALAHLAPAVSGIAENPETQSNGGRMRLPNRRRPDHGKRILH